MVFISQRRLLRGGAIKLSLEGHKGDRCRRIIKKSLRTSEKAREESDR